MQRTTDPSPAGSRDVRTTADLFHSLADSLDDVAVFVLDSQGCCECARGGVLRLTGWQSSELSGRHLSCLYSPEDRTAGKPARDLHAATEYGRHQELRGLVRSNGARFSADVTIIALQREAGSAHGFLMLMRNVTQERLQRMSGSIVELAINAMIMVDGDGRIALVNSQTEKLFGYSRHELIGQFIEILVPERARKRHPEYRQSYVLEPAVRPMGAGRDLYGRRKDGSEFPVEIGLNPIQTEEGLFILGSIVDITERKQLEQKTREQLAQLAHASRLTTVGEMVSGLAHEINQPLGAAANYARACVRLAKSGKASTEELIGWMEKAALENGRACEIISRVRAYVRKDASPHGPVDINQVVQYVANLTGSSMWCGREQLSAVEPELDLAPELPYVRGIRVQIEQVLVNLVRNAMEAMQDLPAAQRRLAIRSWHESGFVHVAVSDSGPGIAPEHLTRLFRPFFSTKTAGMGLGLSISRSIVEAHGGTLTVTSKLSAGTTFAVTLPVAGQETAP